MPIIIDHSIYIRVASQLYCHQVLISYVCTMPKVKEKSDSFLRRMAFDKPDIFTSDGSVLFCKICDKNVFAKQKCEVDQHCGGKTHKKI